MSRKVSNNKILTLKQVLSQLTKMGMIAEDDAKRISEKRKNNKLHPLVILAKEELKDRRSPNLPLTIEKLFKWLAEYSGKQFIDINPLKLDTTAVTSILPMAYCGD